MLGRASGRLWRRRGTTSQRRFLACSVGPSTLVARARRAGLDDEGIEALFRNSDRRLWDRDDTTSSAFLRAGAGTCGVHPVDPVETGRATASSIGPSSRTSASNGVRSRLITGQDDGPLQGGDDYDGEIVGALEGHAELDETLRERFEPTVECTSEHLAKLRAGACRIRGGSHQGTPGGELLSGEIRRQFSTIEASRALGVLGSSSLRHRRMRRAATSPIQSKASETSSSLPPGK